MKKCSKSAKYIVRSEISKDEALNKFKDDPYKIDLISRMDENDTVISCYTQGDFTDLCRGPHVDTVKDGILLDSWDSSSEIPLYYYYHE